MKINKLLFIVPLGALLMIVVSPAQADSSYGKTAYSNGNKSIYIAYKNYNRSYRDPYYGHKKYKHRNYQPKRIYGKSYYRGYDRRYDRRVYRDPYNSYREGGRYCPRY